jgi:hypothetical protein
LQKIQHLNKDFFLYLNILYICLILFFKNNNKLSIASKNKKDILSEPTLKRLPEYLYYLQCVTKKGIIYISAPAMAKELEHDATQIVKDLSPVFRTF